jgi:hypothetical protein
MGIRASLPILRGRVKGLWVEFLLPFSPELANLNTGIPMLEHNFPV